MARSSSFPSICERVGYVYGGRISAHREWVRHDLTDAGWQGRALVRLLLQVLPAAAVLALLPGPAYLHVLLPLFVLLTGGFIGVIYADELRERRLRQHGFEPPVDPRR
jgi:hypothetical protein